MDLKLLQHLSIFLIIFISGINLQSPQIQNATEDEDYDFADVGDFDFNAETAASSNVDESSSQQPNEEFENDVDYNDEADETNVKQQLGSSKETMVRQVILNSMKTAEMKDKVARVLPILRVMSPDQKLALATLVTTQVLAPPTSKGLSLEEVIKSLYMYFVK